MISTSMMYQQQANIINLSNQKWLSAGLSLSTMKRVVNPSDDALAASQAVRLQQSLGLNQQYATARSFAQSSIGLSENVTQNVNQALFSVKETIVYAGNATMTDEDRAILANQLEGLKNELLGLANTRDGLGNYIFSGFKTDTVPFVKDAVTGEIVYQGGDTPISQKVEAQRELNVSYLGSDIFNGMPSNPVTEPDGTPSGVKGIFNTLDTLIGVLKTPTTGGQPDLDALNEALATANRAVTNSLENIGRVQTDMGLALKELDNLDDLGAQQKLSGQERISDLVDLDAAQGISDYMLNLNSLQASYQTFMDMKGLSLFSLAR